MARLHRLIPAVQSVLFLFFSRAAAASRALLGHCLVESKLWASRGVGQACTVLLLDLLVLIQLAELPYRLRVYSVWT